MCLLALALAAAPAEPLAISVGSHVEHAVSESFMGCHSDSGFVHQVRGWSAQLVFGESFEAPPNRTKPGQSSYAWQPVISPALRARATIAGDPARPFAGQSSQRIAITSGAGTGTAGLANRGLGNEGLYLEAGKPYEGYFFARSAAAATLEVRLETTAGGVLASARIAHGGGAEFVQHRFELTPAAGTQCVGIAPGSDPTVHCTAAPPGSAHVCVRCGGQFVVAVVAAEGAAAEVNVDYVVLQPGPWGRFKGLNARADVAAVHQAMGIKAIRLGGSFCSVTKDNGRYYQWQDWTGPVWSRPSVGAHWDSYGNDAYNLIGGWGLCQPLCVAASRANPRPRSVRDDRLREAARRRAYRDHHHDQHSRVVCRPRRVLLGQQFVSHGQAAHRRRAPRAVRAALHRGAPRPAALQPPPAH